MIHRPFNEQEIFGSFDLNGWRCRAAAACQRAMEARAAGKDHEFESAIWRELKPFLLNYFFGKCAYCEVKITAGFWGDVEHFRPKKKVEDEPGHPGYYWLAYEPSNLMPSCQLCNQGKGKKNWFPVDTGTRAWDERGVSREHPLLLTPYADRPLDHLNFTFESGRPTGFVQGKTDRGRKSVEVYGLNRHELVDERLQAQLETLTAWDESCMAYNALVRKGIDEAICKAIRQSFIASLGPKQTFAAARVGALEAWIEWKTRREREDFRGSEV